MPLTPGARTISGGCNCRAIRYTVTIPPLEQRLLHPTIPPSTAASPSSSGHPACHLPFTTWDHCNDCRAATGALLPAWLCTPVQAVSVTCIRTDSAAAPEQTDKTYDIGTTVPAGKFPTLSNDNDHGSTSITGPGLTMLTPPFTSVTAGTWLRFHHSSPEVTRSFCGRCGTSLSYYYANLPESWPRLLDICLGTVDREDLEVEDGKKGVLQPERQMFWRWGIPWLRRITWQLEGPKHETFMLGREVKTLE